MVMAKSTSVQLGKVHQPTCQIESHQLKWNVQTQLKKKTSLAHEHASAVSETIEKLCLKIGHAKTSWLPSGKRTNNYGKIHHVQWENPTISTGPFSIAMLVYQRVNTIKSPLNPIKPPFSYGFPMVFLWFVITRPATRPSSWLISGLMAAMAGKSHHFFMAGHVRKHLAMNYKTRKMGLSIVWFEKKYVIPSGKLT